MTVKMMSVVSTWPAGTTFEIASTVRSSPHTIHGCLPTSAVAHPSWPVFRPLNWWAMRKLGQLSYTFYLAHFVIIKGLEYHGIAAGSLWLIILAAGLSIVYAEGVYRYVEKPFREMRRNLTGHPAGQ